MIRVLRVLEYEYDTPERMINDMSNWTISPRPWMKGMRMQSSVVSTTTISTSEIPPVETEEPVRSTYDFGADDPVHIDNEVGWEGR